MCHRLAARGGPVERNVGADGRVPYGRTSPGHGGRSLSATFATNSHRPAGYHQFQPGRANRELAERERHQCLRARDGADARWHEQPTSLWHRRLYGDSSRPPELLVEDAVKRGARVVTGGKRPGQAAQPRDPGSILPPSGWIPALARVARGFAPCRKFALGRDDGRRGSQPRARSLLLVGSYEVRDERRSTRGLPVRAKRAIASGDAILCHRFLRAISAA